MSSIDLLTALEDKDNALSKLVADTLASQHGHRDLVGLIFEIAQEVTAERRRLLDALALEKSEHERTRERLKACADGKCPCMYAGK